ncbi:hypothetical protein GCM10009007_19380 [Formosimonas limnophila]|uniref:Uncharacterized protein n=2 Tax=Formosimonas limnophila TaxID=1384487 RepID=A0A8J3G0Y9_9BURK|nr:hypothetical protein GCM10009007_19380 [Formosimonas limnophila]
MPFLPSGRYALAGKLKQARHRAAIELGWDFRQADECTLSELAGLFDSDEYKEHGKFENERLGVLLKSIHGVAKVLAKSR